MPTTTDTAARVTDPDTQAGSIGPRKPREKVKLFGLRALWLHFADEIDLSRLAKLHVRIRLKERALHDLKEERRQIMRRCTRRMQRAQSRN